MISDLKNPLTPLQLELLKAFASPSVDEADLHEIRVMLSRYFAQKASKQAHEIVESRGMTPKDVEAIAHEHRRSSSVQP